MVADDRCHGSGADSIRGEKTRSGKVKVAYSMVKEGRNINIEY